MESHPLNPMTDPDIRRWLERQVKGAVGHVPLTIVRRGAEAVRAALDAEGAKGRRLAVVDAVEDSDLSMIGAAAMGDALITGGSGVALACRRISGAAGCCARRPKRAERPGDRVASFPDHARRSRANRWLLMQMITQFSVSIPPRWWRGRWMRQRRFHG
jgi:uncharacterized protein YgbK (DUF1537 family)